MEDGPENEKPKNPTIVETEIPTPHVTPSTLTDSGEKDIKREIKEERMEKIRNTPMVNRSFDDQVELALYDDKKRFKKLDNIGKMSLQDRRLLKELYAATKTFKIAEHANKMAEQALREAGGGPGEAYDNKKGKIGEDGKRAGGTENAYAAAKLAYELKMKQCKDSNSDVLKLVAGQAIPQALKRTEKKADMAKKFQGTFGKRKGKSVGEMDEGELLADILEKLFMALFLLYKARELQKGKKKHNEEVNRLLEKANEYLQNAKEGGNTLNDINQAASDIAKASDTISGGPPPAPLSKESIEEMTSRLPAPLTPAATAEQKRASLNRRVPPTSSTSPTSSATTSGASTPSNASPSVEKIKTPSS